MPDHYPVNKIVTTTRPNRHGNLTSSNQALSKSTAHTIKIQNSPARARRKLRFHSLARLLSTTLARTFHKTSANSSTSQRKQKTQERLPPPTPHLHDERETIIHEPLSNTKTLRYSHTYTTTQRQKTKKKKKKKALQPACVKNCNSTHSLSRSLTFSRTFHNTAANLSTSLDKQDDRLPVSSSTTTDGKGTTIGERDGDSQRTLDDEARDGWYESAECGCLRQGNNGVVLLVLPAWMLAVVLLLLMLLMLLRWQWRLVQRVEL